MNNLIIEKEQEITGLNLSISQFDNEINNMKVELKNMQSVINNIPTWNEIFGRANIEQKKAMLSNIIDKIIVYKDSLEVTFKFKSQNIESPVNVPFIS